MLVSEGFEYVPSLHRAAPSRWPRKVRGGCPAVAAPVFHIVTQSHDGHCMVTVAGEVDMTTALVLRKALDLACDEPTRAVSVSLSEVGFFDAQAIAVFVHTANRLRGNGRWLHLCGVSPFQEKILRIFDLQLISMIN